MGTLTGTKYLLDSVILIDHFNGIVAASEFLRQYRTDTVLSAITRAEVLTGFDNQDRVLAARLLDAFPCLTVDKEAADLAASLRRSHRWKLPDAFQAALAQMHGLKLVTRNTKDFSPEQDFVLVPYQI